MATQAQHAAEDGGKVDREGRWVRASAPALEAETKRAMTMQLAERPGGGGHGRQKASQLSRGGSGVDKAQTKLELM